MQAQLAALVGELGLPTFPQNSDGDVVFQRMSREAPQRYRGMTQEPQSMRLVGGMGILVRVIASSLPAESLRLDSRLTRLTLTDDAVEARFVEAGGTEENVSASHVILALPPRLLEATMSFSPALGEATAARWRGTPTWMAPHAKFFALYDRPFWRDAGLSGTAQSMVGPLAEIHDATTAAERLPCSGSSAFHRPGASWSDGTPSSPLRSVNSSRCSDRRPAHLSRPCSRTGRPTL